MLTPAGALFDGDAVQLEVECGPYTDVTLTTASATKLNRCDSGEIQFAMQVRVAAGATFRYLPHELIPFRGARYRQRLSVDLHGSGQAWLLEVVTPGPSNARFAFTRLDLATRVSHDAKVVVRERFAITPDAADQLHRQTHYGSLLLLGSNMPDASRLNARLGCEHHAGATALPSHGVGLKALGGSAHQVRQTLLESAQLPGWLEALLPP
jgi:urease accessory protein